MKESHDAEVCGLFFLHLPVTKAVGLFCLMIIFFMLILCCKRGVSPRSTVTGDVAICQLNVCIIMEASLHHKSGFK